jgi:hypothetical protein
MHTTMKAKYLRRERRAYRRERQEFKKGKGGKS